MISVVVPIYKVEPFLRRCVDSVLNQTYKDFALILVDDGSPDRCGEICDDYARQDPRVRVIHRENGGLSAARNSGIDWVQENGVGDWITFIDSDDWVHPRYLELLLHAAESTGLRVAAGGFERTSRQEGVAELPERPDVTVCQTEEFYCEKKVNATVAWGKLYRREDFAALRYPEGKIHEDEFTTYKVLFSYPAVAFVDGPLYLYYQNPRSIMGGGWNPKHIAECDALQEQLAFFAKNGYRKAYRTVAEIYLRRLYINERSAKSDEAFRAEQKVLARRLKTELKRYGKPAGVTIRTAPWLYYEAFPTLTLPYRAAKKLLGKTRKG